MIYSRIFSTSSFMSSFTLFVRLAAFVVECDSTVFRYINQASRRTVRLVASFKLFAFRFDNV